MSIELKIPTIGESITEVQIDEWLKSPGETVRQDEPIVALETEKTSLDLPSPVSGVLVKVLKKKGELAHVGEVIAYLDEAAVPKDSIGSGVRQTTASAPASNPFGLDARHASDAGRAPAFEGTPAWRRGADADRARRQNAQRRCAPLSGRASVSSGTNLSGRDRFRRRGCPAEVRAASADG